MHDIIQQLLLDSPFYQGAAILLVAIFMALLAPLPREYQAFYWFSLLARSLSAKVARSDRSPGQQRLAGSLSVLLLVLPFWLILSFLLELAAFPWFFECLFLYLCLCDEQFHKVAEETGQALERQDKQRARRLLSQWVYRDTRELSEVGMSKTVIEKLMTTSIYGTVATILFYAVGGAPLVLGARMIKQLEYTWPALNPQYREFGRPAYLLSYLIYWLPTQAWNFTLAIQGGPGALVQMLRPVKSPLPINNHLTTCALAAKVLDTELGGPQKFAGKRVDIARIGTGPKPTPHTISAALKLLRLSKGIWVLSVLLIPSLWAMLRLLAHA
ncbi:cobalamin biosynthesis protein [Shewanella sp. Isolate8]|uniref:cobalamin biosynthesis protein CobD/CbiB n=1 Tax=Shewanella sp. Isolate8 TaxID=2908529 RepID=UPI001EFDEAAB|nr:cobalamin biosynthesis protein [Shewanella sp. Isolate8]MCG9745536.1 cobalamin biosynthesis protein [Shewanella sp. Isolate8]